MSGDTKKKRKCTSLCTRTNVFFWQKSEIYLDWQDLELLKHLFTTGLFLYHPKTEKQSFSDVLERGQ